MSDYTAKENQALAATQKRHKPHIFFEGGKWNLCCYQGGKDNMKAYAFTVRRNK